MAGRITRLGWCLKRGKRLRRTKPDPLEAGRHIKKADHNLNAARYNILGGFSDWAVSQAYYAMYHGLLAILAAKGYESRNHECTLTAVEHLIGAKETELTLEELYFIRNAGQNTDLDAKSLRETFQYGTRVTVEKELLDRLLGKAKR